MNVCVIIPCFNEASAIGKVVSDFKSVLPDAEIHVFDNASLDDTREVASHAGAQVHNVSQRGKGNVVRAMFRDIEADYYIMVDGDGTYPAHYASEMLGVIVDMNADIVIGDRMITYENSGSRSGHFAGNKILTGAVNYLFGSNINDLLSGYRVLSRRFVKSIPLFAEGFEVETAMSIHAIEVDANVVEYPIEYLERIDGSESKLNTVSDGLRIGWTVFKLFKDHKPKIIYGLVASLLFILSLLVGIPVVTEFLRTGLVPKFPSAILASGMMIVSFMFGFSGLILSAISKSRREIKKLSFISMR